MPRDGRCFSLSALQVTSGGITPEMMTVWTDKRKYHGVVLLRARFVIVTCQNGEMLYEHDDDARREAARHTIAGDELARLRDLCARKASDLGPEGVRGHCVGFSPTAWAADAECLPEAIRSRAEISRGDVAGIATEVLARVRPADGELHLGHGHDRLWPAALP
jgi:hypothetical protein